MYKVGDLILYASTGVCRVADIATNGDLPGADRDRLYYVLKPLYQDCIISTPVDTTKVFMRPIISKDEAEQLIDTIPSIKVEVFHSHVMRELTEHYEASIRTYDCGDLLAMTMSIHEKKVALEQQKRKFGAVDEKFMKRGEDLLFGELAAALDIPREAVLDYIAERVEGGRKVSGDEPGPSAAKPAVH